MISFLVLLVNRRGYILASFFDGVSVGQRNGQNHVIVHCYLAKGLLFDVINVDEGIVVDRTYLRENVALIIEIYYVINYRNAAAFCEINHKLLMDFFDADDLMAVGINGLVLATKLYGRIGSGADVFYLVHDSSDLGYLDGLVKIHDVVSLDAGALNK